MSSPMMCYSKISLFLLGTGFTCLALNWLSKLSNYFRKFRLVGSVDGLYCYPVASCDGMMNRVATCTIKGLKMMGSCDQQFIIGRETDETFAVSSPHGTIKQYYTNRLREIRSICNGSDLLLYSSDGDTFTLSLKHMEKKDQVTEQLYRAENIVAVCDLGDEVAAWLNSKLSLSKIRLYQVISDVISTNPGRSTFGNYVFAVQESIEYVNKTIAPRPPLKASYFRPNILLSGCSPFDEVNWEYIQIGKVHFRVTGSDCRIISTNSSAQSINWKTSWETPPTLPNDVKVVDGSNFSAELGINAKVMVEGEINVGDLVYAAY